jgi:hypothetical protein
MDAARHCPYPDKKLTRNAVFDITAGLTGESQGFSFGVACASAVDPCCHCI